MDDNLLHFPEELSSVIIIYRFLSLKLVVISEDLLNLHKLIGKPLNQIWAILAAKFFIHS